MELLDLFIASSIPVVKVLLLTALGSFLALDRIDLLGPDSRKHLNNIVFFVFSPALISSNLANTITFHSMSQLWFMPFNVLITFIIGTLFGWILLLITRPPQHLRGLVVGCCAAGNLGNMLLIIIPAVCKESGSPFGAPDACHSYGMAYASLSMALGAMFLWSYVYNIMRISTRDSPDDDGGSCTQPLLSAVALPSNAQESALSRIRHRAQVIVKKLNLKRLFAPPTLAAIAGFVVGLVPMFRKGLIGETAPLHVIQDTALLLGDGAIPCLTLIMGANLLKGLKASETPKSIIVGIIAVRYVAMPLAGVGILKLAVKLGLVRGNPLYQFVLLLQFALPPAMNIGTMTQLFGVGESECSVIMLWSYALASVALTFWSTCYMWLVASA